MDTSALRLPQEFAEKIGTERVMIRKVSEGLLLTPIPKQERKLRGMLKGKGFSTERYLEKKRADAVAERLAAFRELTDEMRVLNETEPLLPEYDEILQTRVNFTRELGL